MKELGDDTKLQRITALVQHPLEEISGSRSPENDNLIPGIHGRFGTVRHTRRASVFEQGLIIKHEKRPK